MRRIDYSPHHSTPDWAKLHAVAEGGIFATEPFGIFEGRSVFFDRSGQPMTLKEWAAAFGDHRGRMIGRDVVGQYSVITMWHGHDPDLMVPARIFGTAVFTETSGLVSEILSVTEDEARELHATTVAAMEEEVGAMREEP